MKSPLSIKAILERYTADIEATIQAVLAGSPPFLHGAISYHFGWVDQNFVPASHEPGKMLRPTLLLLVFEALTGAYKPALPAAAAIEMIHNFSLIHDDIEDNDEQRRGRATVWSVWGQPRAINAGDFLYALSYKPLLQLDRQHFSAETVLTMLRLVQETCVTLTEGQDLDMRFETEAMVTTDDYLLMVSKKTAALLQTAIVGGAVLGGAEEAVLRYYREFAQNIGIAFQIRDDILGIWGDTSKTGKSDENDVRRKKKSLPIIHMLSTAEGERAETLRACYRAKNPLTEAEIAFVKEGLAVTGSKAYTEQVASQYEAQAFAALKQLQKTNHAPSELEQLARFLIERTY